MMGNYTMNEIKIKNKPKTYQNKLQKKRNFGWGEGISLLVLVAIAISILYPLIWMVISSMKSYTEIYNNVWGVPSEWLVNNYKSAWEKGIARYFYNSFFITSVTIVGVVLISSMAAYALARYRSRLVDVGLLIVMVGMMVNPQVCLIPLYTMLDRMGLINTPWAMILPYIAFRLPLSILLIRSYFIGIPREIEESAIIDGCSDFRIYRSIYLPIARPILVTVVVLTAYYAWNEFLFATIFINSEKYKTIPSGLMNFRDALQTDWGVLLAGMVISAVPMIILLIVLQKHLVRGLSEGGVKG